MTIEQEILSARGVTPGSRTREGRCPHLPSRARLGQVSAQANKASVASPLPGRPLEICHSSRDSRLKKFDLRPQDPSARGFGSTFTHVILIVHGARTSDLSDGRGDRTYVRGIC